ncbi:MAG: putative Ig domain-containing protein [Prosthecobacter sp.]|nr:putative Ig domain-containing protein [Prosthecobacter sp.]
MTKAPLIRKLKKVLARYSSLLLLFQRSPLVQMLFPQANLLASSAVLNSTGFAIATVVGLGAYDSVAGATALVQIAPNPPPSTTVPITAGVNQNGLVVFQVTGSPNPPEAWTVAPTSPQQPPAGLTLVNAPGSTTTLNGSTTELGDKMVRIRAWRFSTLTGEFVEKLFTFRVTAPAAIATHPASIAISTGSTTTLTVVATGSPTLNYQWFEGASGVTTTPVGTNSASFTTPALFATTNYWVKVTNTQNPSGAFSNTATVTVGEPAAITTHPVSTTIDSGQSTLLSVVASGDAPLTYQWFQGTSGVTTTPVGTDSDSFTTPALTNTTSYWVKVTNAVNPTGASSNTATVTVRQPAAITTHPASTTINSGQTTTLSVVASGDAPLTYQWFQGTSGVTTTPVGTDSASFTTPVLTATTNYWVKVTNALNLTGADSTTATVTVRQPAAITTHPESTTIISGQTTALSVVASGTEPLTYQWYQGATGTTTNPVGTNADSFTTPVLTATTSYWVKVTNIANPTGADSNTATVTVQQPAAITTHPASTIINSGENTTLSVIASGDAPLSYQWYEGASGVTMTPVGTDSASFTTPVLTTTTSYWVKVTNAVNPPGANSTEATVTVLPVTPPSAQAMSQNAGLVTPSSRGNLRTTWFGWETFNEPAARAQPIDDSTPDIGTTPDGANFQTTNAEDHVLDNGNLFFASGSLAEQITVPTSGTVGAEGFTTIILQIATPAASGAFPAPITLGSINGVAPIVVQALNSGGDGQLWAMWKLPGNEASYTITITGSPGQANFSFDSVVVDTVFSTSGFLADTMAAVPPSITTASPLPVAVIGDSYSQQLAGTGGTAPYQFVVSAGSLPEGLSLSADGLLSGTPTATSTSQFTVLISDVNDLITTKDFNLSVTTAPGITTPSALATGLTGTAYTVNFAASGGTTPYTWTHSGGALPDGLNLSTDGVLSGTPTAIGASNFTLQVQDANGLTDSETYSLTISDLTIVTATLPTAVTGVAFTATLGGTGGTQPFTWDLVTGAPPAGIILSDAGVISGTTTAGGSTFTVRLTDDTGFSVTKQLTLPVSAIFIAPVIDPINFPPVTIGTDFNYTVTAANYPKTFAITGLPKGLKFTAATRLISGRPDVSGVFNVQVRATNTGGASPMVTAPLIVKPLDKNLVGTFGGIVDRDAVNRGLGGSLTITTTSIGSYSVKLIGALANIGTGVASASYTATGRLAASAPHIVVSLGGQPLSLTFNATNGQMTGTLGSAAVTGWRSFWNTLANPAGPLQGYYSFALKLSNEIDIGVASIPQGTGFATFSVSLSGSLAIVGKTADGETITSSSFLGADGEFGVYTPLYKNLGTILGQLNLTQDVAAIFVDNTVSGSLTWFKPTTTSRAYAATFGPINLTAEGAYLAPCSPGRGRRGPGSARRWQRLVRLHGRRIGCLGHKPEHDLHLYRR